MFYLSAVVVVVYLFDLTRHVFVTVTVVITVIENAEEKQT